MPPKKRSVDMTASSDSLPLFPEGEAPKKNTRRKKSAEASSAAEKTEAPAVVAEEKKKTTRRTTKTAKVAATEAAAEEAPVKKTTTRTRKTAAAAKAEPEAPAAAEPAAKTTRKKATTTRKSTQAAAAEKTEEPAAEAPAAKTTRKPRSRAAAEAALKERAKAAAAALNLQSTETEEWKPGGRKGAAEPAAEPAPEPAAPAAPAAPAGPILQPTSSPRVIVESIPPSVYKERAAARERGEYQGGGGGRFRRHDRRRDRDFRDRGDREQRGRHEAAAQQPPATETVAEPVEETPREIVYAEGIVEVSGKGFGFLRDPKRNFSQHPSDIFVTPEVCRKYNLRDGQWIKGEIRRGNRGLQLYKLTAIEGEDPEKYRIIPMFEELTTINPNHFIKLETTPERYTTRVIDMMAPIGRGQRGLIVAPPRTGKTTLLQHIAEAVITNHPNMKLIILLVDERPEEVTEIRRTVPQAEIMASSNDMDLKSHTRIAQLAIERAKRLVEMGKHVFVLLDSITRVGRAFNNVQGGGGRTMSGGVDARALEIPRKLFAAARNTEEAGSLTIIATALIETGSRMDELIFQEFKGTGNMELVLDRKISDLRIYPAVDIFQSGTRREELLLPESDLHKINIIRRGLAGHKPAEAIERLLSFMKRFPSNAQLLREIPG